MTVTHRPGCAKCDRSGLTWSEAAATACSCGAAEKLASPAAQPLPTRRMHVVEDLRDQIECVTSDSAVPLFRGMLHAEVGEGESGKTWIAAHAVLDVARQVSQVVIIDGEMSASAWRRRLDALGATHQDRQLISYVEMDARSVDPDALAATCQALTANPSWPAVGLIAWDSALSMISRVARSENDNAEVSRVYDQLRDVVRRTDAAGFIVDHSTRGSGSLVSRGATAKFNALDVSYGVRLAEGSVPSPVENWSSVISVEKDRHGLLGKRSDREASFFPLGAGGLQLDITERDSATHRLSGEAPIQKIVRRIAELDPAPTSANKAFEQLGGNRPDTLKAFKAWKETQS